MPNELVTIEFGAFTLTVSPSEVATVRAARRVAINASWGMPEDATAYVNNNGQVQDHKALVAGDTVRFFKQNATSGC